MKNYTEYLTKLSNLQDYKWNHVNQYFEMIIYTIIAFSIPLVIGHSQILVGTIVNAALIAGALNLKGYKLLPVIIAPSLGALTAGLLFGPLTIYLLYMIPFIWVGNSILVLSFKWLKLKLNKNYFITLLLGSGLKSGFLFISALILYSLGLIPVMFLTAMGIIQLVTAIGGGIPAYASQFIRKKVVNSN